LGELLEAVGRQFSHRPGNPATVGVVRWPSADDTAGYRLRRPKLTPVSLISMSTPHELSRLVRYVNWCEVGRCDATWDHAFSIAYNTPPLVRSHNSTSPSTVLFCSLTVVDPRVGHTMDVLSPFIRVLFLNSNVNDYSFQLS